MELQYIVDNKGNRTDVIIPIDQWNGILIRHPELRKLLKESIPSENNAARFRGLLTEEEAKKMIKDIEEAK